MVGGWGAGAVWGGGEIMVMVVVVMAVMMEEVVVAIASECAWRDRARCFLRLISALASGLAVCDPRSTTLPATRPSAPSHPEIWQSRFQNKNPRPRCSHRWRSLADWRAVLVNDRAALKSKGHASTPRNCV